MPRDPLHPQGFSGEQIGMDGLLLTPIDAHVSLSENKTVGEWTPFQF